MDLKLRLNMRRVRTLAFFANYAYIDAIFDDTDEDGNPQELAGNRFRLTPEHSFSLGADVNVPLSSRAEVFFRPTYSFKSKVFSKRITFQKFHKTAMDFLT
jgi:outer membrane receptor protein involved in Fe transport